MGKAKQGKRKAFDEKGTDSEGVKFSSLQNLWKETVGTVEPTTTAETTAPTTSNQFGTPDGWYGIGAGYWEKVDATVEGMLGGFGKLTEKDVRDSTNFLNQFFTHKTQPLGKGYALDCGSGIGRVAHNLLMPLFDKVDTVEQDPKFVETARKSLPEDKVPRTICSGLQAFTPDPKFYDLIWVQWVSGYITDADYVEFLKRCKTGIKSNGLICLKENITSDGFVLDREDASITRSDKHMRALITEAGLSVVTSALQTDFPKELFAVRMYACR